MGCTCLGAEGLFENKTVTVKQKDERKVYFRNKPEKQLNHEVTDLHSQVVIMQDLISEDLKRVKEVGEGRGIA
jgi:hypothetical protein